MHPVPYYYTRPRVRSYSPNQSIVKYIGIGYMWRSVGNGYIRRIYIKCINILVAIMHKYAAWGAIGKVN